MYCLALLLLAGAAYGGIVKRSACSGPTLLTPSDITAALDAHNLYRSQAGNSDAANEIKLTWSDDLASRAQDWANLCLWKHTLTNDCAEENGVGQNLYLNGGGAAISTSYDVSAFVKAWADEKQDYTYSNASCSGVCGHYTQLAWAKTSEVGCGMQFCETVQVNDDPAGYTNAIVFACDYNPPGNYQGQKPYNEGMPCSECGQAITGTGWTCNNNLCEPCTPDANGDSCVCEAKECLNGGSFDNGQCVCNCPDSFYGEICENSCSCADLTAYAASCPAWTSFCSNPSYKVFMQTNCPATCNMCDLPPSCTA